MQEVPSPRPSRAAKIKCIKNLSTIASEERSHDLNSSREQSRHRLQQRQFRLADMRQRAFQRVENESSEQREVRPSQLRQRATQRAASESIGQREQRLLELQQRASQRVSSGTEENNETIGI